MGASSNSIILDRQTYPADIVQKALRDAGVDEYYLVENFTSLVHDKTVPPQVRYKALCTIAVLLGVLDAHGGLVQRQASEDSIDIMPEELYEQSAREQSIIDALCAEKPA